MTTHYANVTTSEGPLSIKCETYKEANAALQHLRGSGRGSRPAISQRPRKGARIEEALGNSNRWLSEAVELVRYPDRFEHVSTCPMSARRTYRRKADAN